MTKVAILSVAHMHAHGYCGALQAIQGVEITGVYDDNVERAQTFAEQRGINSFHNMDELINRSDAVIICSENANHLSYIERAARLGKPVLCEKPLSSDVESGLKILEVVQASRIPFYMALPIRFVPSVQQARMAVQNGSIGRVLSMCGTNHGSVPGGWFVEKELSGGGAVADHVPHVVDIMRWILGQDVTTVYAEISSGDFSPVIDDSAILTMSWSDGTFSTMDPSWSRKQGIYPEWGDVFLEVVGTKGVVTVDAHAQKIDAFTNQAPNHRYLSYGENADLNLVSEFVACIREGRKSEILASAEDGMHALRVAAAAYESAKTGRATSMMVTSS